MSDLRNPPDEIRDRIRDVVRRPNRDPQYATRLVANPMEELKAAGLPPQTAQAVLDVQVPDSASEVEGYLRCVDTACWVTPYASLCPGTCMG